MKFMLFLNIILHTDYRLTSFFAATFLVDIFAFI